MIYRLKRSNIFFCICVLRVSVAFESKKWSAMRCNADKTFFAKKPHKIDSYKDKSSKFCRCHAMTFIFNLQLNKNIANQFYFYLRVNWPRISRDKGSRQKTRYWRDVGLTLKGFIKHSSEPIWLSGSEIWA